MACQNYTINKAILIKEGRDLHKENHDYLLSDTVGSHIDLQLKYTEDSFPWILQTEAGAI